MICNLSFEFCRIPINLLLFLKLYVFTIAAGSQPLSWSRTAAVPLPDRVPVAGSRWRCLTVHTLPLWPDRCYRTRWHTANCRKPVALKPADTQCINSDAVVSRALMQLSHTCFIHLLTHTTMDVTFTGELITPCTENHSFMGSSFSRSRAGEVYLLYWFCFPFSCLRIMNVYLQCLCYLQEVLFVFLTS